MLIIKALIEKCLYNYLYKKLCSRMSHCTKNIENELENDFMHTYFYNFHKSDFIWLYFTLLKVTKKSLFRLLSFTFGNDIFFLDLSGHNFRRRYTYILLYTCLCLSISKTKIVITIYRYMTYGKYKGRYITVSYLSRFAS